MLNSKAFLEIMEVGGYSLVLKEVFPSEIGNSVLVE